MQSLISVTHLLASQNLIYSRTVLDNPMYIYSEVGPLVISGAYFQVNEPGIRMLDLELGDLGSNFHSAMTLTG